MQRPTAKNILDGIVQAMHDSQEPLDDDVVLVPGVYVVMLHPKVYQELQVLLPRIKEQALRRLDAELEGLNARRGWVARVLGRVFHPLLRLFSAEHYGRKPTGRAAAYERAGDRWHVDVVVTAEPEAGVDYLSVETDFGVQAAPVLKGRPTVNIRRRTMLLPDGRFETVLSMPRGEGGSATARSLPAAHRSSDILARLSYEDNAGRHLYYMRKPEIVLGRADESAPSLDVALDTLSDVSRRHARIRHDAEADVFTIQSLGRYGVTVDGRRVPPTGEEADDEEEVAVEAWHPLPRLAEIGLADAVYIHFEALTS